MDDEGLKKKTTKETNKTAQHRLNAVGTNTWEWNSVAQTFRMCLSSCLLAP